MTIDLPITDDNAESIGRPILNKIIESLSASDHEQIIRDFPELKEQLASGVFLEAAKNVETMGELLSIEYLARLNKVENHLLLWKIAYRKSDIHLAWYLSLADEDGTVKVTGFGFDG